MSPDFFDTDLKFFQLLEKLHQSLKCKKNPILIVTSCKSLSDIIFANICRILYLQISAGYYICKMYKFDFGQVCVKGPQHQDPKLLKIVTWEEWSVPLHNIFHVYTFDLRRILSILYYCGVDHYPLPWDNEIVMNIFGDLLFKNSQRHKLIEFIEKIFFSK